MHKIFYKGINKSAVAIYYYIAVENDHFHINRVRYQFAGCFVYRMEHRIGKINLCGELPGKMCYTVIQSKRNNVGWNMNYTYIVECSDKSLYTGWTTNLEKRLAMHNQGKGARYTRSRRPVKLVYFEEFSTKEEAMKREYVIKQYSRMEKLRLINDKMCSLPSGTEKR